MKRLFERHIDERHHNATIRFLEFLQLIYLWRDLVGPYDVVLSDRVLVQAMGAGMQELIKACKTYGITADSRIKMSELQFMIGDMLPDADPAAQIVARLGLAEPFTFVQILGVVYVAVRGTAFLSSGLRTKSLRNALPDDHTGTVGHIATGQVSPAQCCEATPRPPGAGRSREVVEWPCTVGGGGVTPPPPPRTPPPPSQRSCT